MCSVHRIDDSHVLRIPDATRVRPFIVLWHRRRSSIPTSRLAPTSGGRSDVGAVLLFPSVVTKNVRVFGVTCEDDIFPLSVTTFMRVSEVLILWCLWILLLNLERNTVDNTVGMDHVGCVCRWRLYFAMSFKVGFPWPGFTMSPLWAHITRTFSANL